MVTGLACLVVAVPDRGAQGWPGRADGRQASAVMCSVMAASRSAVRSAGSVSSAYADDTASSTYADEREDVVPGRGTAGAGNRP